MSSLSDATNRSTPKQRAKCRFFSSQKGRSLCPSHFCLLPLFACDYSLSSSLLAFLLEAVLRAIGPCIAVREQSLVRSKNSYFEVSVLYRLSLVKTLSADLAFIAVHVPSVLTCIKDVAPVMLARISTIWPILNARVHSLGPKCRPAQPMGLKIPGVLYKV